MARIAPNTTGPEAVAHLHAAAEAVENLAREHAEHGDVWAVWRIMGKAASLRNMARNIELGRI